MMRWSGVFRSTDRESAIDINRALCCELAHFRHTVTGIDRDDSRERETQAGAEGAAHDLIAPRAERTPDGGLTPALADVVRHHAVDPRDRQQQGQHAECREKQSTESRHGDRPVHAIRHRGDITQRHAWIQ
jgi:hypothetical protein